MRAASPSSVVVMTQQSARHALLLLLLLSVNARKAAVGAYDAAAALTNKRTWLQHHLRLSLGLSMTLVLVALTMISLIRVHVTL